ncbi:MAG: hypothetical protein AB1410_02825 [Acidobacteriota bacterium]
METRTNFTGFYSLFQNGATFLGIFVQNYEFLKERFEIHEGIFIQSGSYRFNNFYSEFESDKSKAISGKIKFTKGNFYDGNITGYGFGTNLKLGAHLTINLLYDHNDVKLKSGNFKTEIIGTRILYTFSPKLFAKAFIQWNSDKNAIIGNFLLSFIHTPGSDFFLVYNEELSKNGKAFKTNNRALMLKFTYLFNI